MPNLATSVTPSTLRSNVLKQHCSSAAASQLVQACKGFLGSKHKKVVRQPDGCSYMFFPWQLAWTTVMSTLGSVQALHYIGVSHQPYPTFYLKRHKTICICPQIPKQAINISHKCKACDCQKPSHPTLLDTVWYIDLSWLFHLSMALYFLIPLDLQSSQKLTIST